MYRRKSHNKGFTMVELLVAVFIFATVVMIAASGWATKFAGGRTRSMANKNLNQEISRAIDILNQKLENANAKPAQSSVSSLKGFGVRSEGILRTGQFDVSNGQLILAISTDPSRNEVDNCTFVGRADDNGRGYLAMKEDGCDQIPIFDVNVNRDRLTSPKINVKDFVLSGLIEPNGAHNLNIKIIAADITDDKAEIEMHTAYNLSYEKIMNLQ